MEEKIDRKIIINGIFEVVFKTLLVIFAVAGFLIACLFCFFPANLAKVAQTLELKNVKAISLERVYLKSGNIADLSKAIEANILAGKNAKAVELIDKMQTNASYNDFVIQTNETMIRQSKKEYLVYICDYDAFLNTQKITCLYNANKKDEAKILALNALEENENVYSWEFGALIDCILTETNSQNGKSFAIANIYNESVANKIENNLVALGDENAKTGLEKLKTIYAKIKINTTIYQIKTTLKQDVSLVSETIDNLVLSYNAELANFSGV